jgi:ABC-type uncharacterized transport system auxiliary subunit
MTRVFRPKTLLTLLAGLLLLLSLSACFPPATAPNGKPALEWSRPEAGKVIVTANLEPTLLITSSTAITDWTPKIACVRSENAEIAARAIKCAVKTIPLTVTALTSGEVIVQIVDGFRPVTKPEIVPR